MMMLWGAGAVLSVLAMLFVILPLRHYYTYPLTQQGSNQGDLNRELLSHELAGLEDRLQAGEFNESEYNQQRLEIERRLLSDEWSSKPAQVERKGGRALVVMALVMIPVLTFALYGKIGGSSQIRQDHAIRQLFSTADEHQRLVNLQDVVKRWPDDYQVRFMLAGIYMHHQRYLDAALEYQTIVVQTQGQLAEPIIQQAQALYLATGNRMSPEIIKLIERALALAPENTVALGMAGIAAFDRDDFRAALGYWQRQLPLTRDAEERASLQIAINRAKAELAEPEVVYEADLQDVPLAAIEGAKIPVHISVDPALIKQLGNGQDEGWQQRAKVFVFARSAASTMPLAIMPLPLSALPRQVVLSDRDLMIADESLANYHYLDVVARLSLSGEVIKADYEAMVRDVTVTDETLIELVLSR